jgi:uncharacterized protein (DUF885 family)
MAEPVETGHGEEGGIGQALVELAQAGLHIAAEGDDVTPGSTKKYEEQLQFSPIQLTFLGRKDLYDQIDDMSEAGIRKQEAWLEASVEEMERPSTTPSSIRKPSCPGTCGNASTRTRATACRSCNGYPFDQMSGMQSLAPTFLINFHKVDDEKDYLAYVARLQKVPVAFDQLLERAAPRPRRASVRRSSPTKA